MSNFYTRYVPPTSKTSPANSPGSTVSKQQTAAPNSRKSGQGETSKRKRKSEDIQDRDSSPKRLKAERKSDSHFKENNARTQLRAGHGKEGQNILEKYSVTGAAKANSQDVVIRQNPALAQEPAGGEQANGHVDPKKPKKATMQKNKDDKEQKLEANAEVNGTEEADRGRKLKPSQELEVPNYVDSPVESKKPKKKKKRKEQILATNGEASPIVETSADQDMEDGKHSGIMSRFAKSKERAANRQPSGGDQDSDTEEDREEQVQKLHGLEPIPQPEQVEIPFETPTYSTLPKWLANPTKVSTDASAPFSSLGLSDDSVSNLKARGLETALPIQSALIPRLVEGSEHYDGDLSISAATGSGKTLAYVLPMVEDLKTYVTTKLRGLIIVPTKDLVNQVRGVCELCASGTSLKIDTAVGSKSLKAEQESFIEVKSVYDPAKHREEQSRPFDWAGFSLENLFDEVDQDPLDSVNRVKQYLSRVDILICTPGRLVDHLRSTKGFSLDHVTWLVIDEADRLLNESYQEWVEVVLPALQSRAATQKQDAILQQMRMELPRRKLRKLALSATMTKDISKLNSLDLFNPKLIVLGDRSNVRHQEGDTAIEDGEPVPDASGKFTLPSTLIESAVAVGDGSEKPLYLLELLQAQTQVLAILSKPKPATQARSSDSDTSSASSDSDISEDDSDSTSSSSSSELPTTTPSTKPTHPSRALIFTRSTESANRLSRLLTLLKPSLKSKIATLTRSSTRKRAIASFKSARTTILIATDRASRGLDVENLEHVINYDVPSSAATYVHRVGRTARAGRVGRAWTLVGHREGRWFWKTIGRGEGDGEVGIQRAGKVMRVSVAVDTEKDGLAKRYEEALKKLGEEVKGK